MESYLFARIRNSELAAVLTELIILTAPSSRASDTSSIAHQLSQMRSLGVDCRIPGGWEMGVFET